MKEQQRSILNDLRLRLIRIRQMKKKLNEGNDKDRRSLEALNRDYEETLELFIQYSMKRFDISVSRVK